MSQTGPSITAQSQNVLTSTPRGVLVIEDDPGVSDLLADLLRESFGPELLVEQATDLNAAESADKYPVP